MAHIGFNDGRIPHAVLGTFDNQVIRMGVRIGDRDKPWSPSVWPFRFHHNWTEHAAQYRWVAVFFREEGFFTAKVLYFDALVPDSIPRLSDGDVVDVVTNVTNNADYDKLDMPFVIRKVCDGKDEPCLKKLRENGAWGFGPTGKATGHEREALQFSPRYDANGKFIFGP